MSEKSKCLWCGHIRTESEWEQQRLSVDDWATLCTRCARKRLRNLHTPDEFGMCEGCGDNEHGYAIVPHPCPTIRELEIK